MKMSILKQQLKRKKRTEVEVNGHMRATIAMKKARKGKKRHL
jgi:hypothetical protein